MSFSFTLTAAGKAAAKAAVVKKLAEVVQSQPVHAHDALQIGTTAEAMIERLEEPNEQQQLVVSVSGSLGGDIDWTLGEVRKLTTANMGVTAYITAKPQEQA